MDIYNINNNKLFLIDKYSHSCDIVKKLINLNLDTAIIYNKISSNQYKILILEKDNSYSTMCGNGCIAMCIKFKKNLTLFNKFNELVQVYYKKNQIKLQLSVTFVEPNIYLVSGEPHKVYYTKIYDKETHRKIGIRNLPDYNTTFIIYKNNKYYFTTFERGVNDFTSACGTGSFACVYFINKNVTSIYTLDNYEYTFEKINDSYILNYNYKNST